MGLIVTGPVAAQTLTISTTSLPNGTNGVTYDQTLQAAGGQTPYGWTNLSGTLPPGLTLAANGILSGTPAANGNFNFTVQLTDASNQMVTQSLTLLVFGPPEVSLQPTNNEIVVGTGGQVSLAVSVSGTGPFGYQWQLNGTNLPNGIINTIAGNGTNGFSGDGGAATNAELSKPYSVASDVAGNLFFTDSLNNRIRKVDTNGIITTVAGTGIRGFSGDGGAATNAELNEPLGVTVDASGNVFIVEYYNQRIRKVDTNGIITTVAGNGIEGYAGDGGAATNAELNNPFSAAVDASGNLFIADGYNGRIRKVNPGGIICTVAGVGTNAYSGDGGAATNAELNYPTGIAVDASGSLFIADYVNQRIRKVDSLGIISTLAGNGYKSNNFGGYSGDGYAATNAELNQPSTVALDASGNVFFSDYGNQRVREVATNGIINTVAGVGTNAFSGDGGPATNAELNYAWGAAVDVSGNLLIADTLNNRIRKVEILGQTLVLNNVSEVNSGAYDVVVSSPYGSTTSGVIQVTVSPPVTLNAPMISDLTNFVFQVSGPANANYTLQVSTDLENWTSLSSSTLPVSGSTCITNPIENLTRQFYRVIP